MSYWRSRREDRREPPRRHPSDRGYAPDLEQCGTDADTRVQRQAFAGQLLGLVVCESVHPRARCRRVCGCSGRRVARFDQVPRRLVHRPLDAGERVGEALMTPGALHRIEAVANRSRAPAVINQETLAVVAHQVVARQVAEHPMASSTDPTLTADRSRTGPDAPAATGPPGARGHHGGGVRTGATRCRADPRGPALGPGRVKCRRPRPSPVALRCSIPSRPRLRRPAAPRTASRHLVTFFDCLQDMGDPVGVAVHVRSTLADDVTWALVEPNASDRLEDNLNPVGRIFYSASTMICVPNSHSQEVGLARRPSRRGTDQAGHRGRVHPVPAGRRDAVQRHLRSPDVKGNVAA